MINRNYLPFKSARAYVDRGMAKWMGFFISEHTSALSHMGDVIDVSEEMSRDEILLALSQVYVNGISVILTQGLGMSLLLVKSMRFFRTLFIYVVMTLLLFLLRILLSLLFWRNYEGFRKKLYSV